MIVFSIGSDGMGMTERVIYLTDAISSNNDGEQRIQLRALPDRFIEYTPLSLSSRETSSLDSLIWEGQSDIFQVPIWWDATALTAAASIGASSVTLDETADRPRMVSGATAILWSDYLTWELVTLGTIGANSAVTTTLTKAWGIGSKLIPIAQCRLINQVSVERPARFANRVPVVFQQIVVP